jgi:hypothetical protein
MIRIVSDGTPFGTTFYDEHGQELTALRNSCMEVRIIHSACEPPVAELKILVSFDMAIQRSDIGITEHNPITEETNPAQFHHPLLRIDRELRG